MCEITEKVEEEQEHRNSLHTGPRVSTALKLGCHKDLPYNIYYIFIYITCHGIYNMPFCFYTLGLFSNKLICVQI